MKRGDSIVAARQGNIMITSFHPELTDDLRFHKYFVDMIIDAQQILGCHLTKKRGEI